MIWLLLFTTLNSSAQTMDHEKLNEEIRKACGVNTRGVSRIFREECSSYIADCVISLDEPNKIDPARFEKCQESALKYSKKWR